jgi:hypothetical protein
MRAAAASRSHPDGKSQDATLADAMDVMNKIPDCQDIFFTTTGAPDEPTLGWITNIIIQENAKV